MNITLKFCVILTGIWALHSYAGEKKGHIQTDYSNAEYETLETGGSVLVPKGVTIIPGLPIVVGDDNLEKMKNSRKSLIDKGFIDKPKYQAFAENTLRRMNQSISNKSNSQVKRLRNFDYSKGVHGRIDKSIMSSDSEGFIEEHFGNSIRAYSNTKFGDIYVSETPNARVGVIGNSHAPNFLVAGFEGYRTTIRYEGGKMTTLVLIPHNGGVSMIELGTDFKGKFNDSDLESFIESFLTMTEEN